MPEFIVEIGDRVERRSFDSERVRIGREDLNEIVIDDSRVSREHALIELHEGRWLLRDLGSANGTFQDEARVRRVVLERGSRFLIADVAEITFLGDESRPTAALAPPVREASPAPPGSSPAAVPVRPSAPAPVAAVPVPGYEIIEELGVGPVSRAYLAHHQASGTAEVLRVPHRADALLEGAATSWNRVDDPTVARLDVLRDTAGNLVLRERLAREGNLADRLAKGGKLELADALELGIRLGRGLATLHRHGIVMGLFRPGRVRLYDDSEPRISGPALLAVDPSLMADERAEDLRYLAPEHLRPEDPVLKPNARSDVYSFGALLYRLVAGAEVVDGKTIEGVRKSALKGPLKTPDERRPGLPEGLSELVMSCLAQDPTERPPELDGVLGLLAEALEKSKTRKRPAGQKLQAKEKEFGERVAGAPKKSLQFRVASWTVTIFLIILVNFLIYWFGYRRWLD